MTDAASADLISLAADLAAAGSGSMDAAAHQVIIQGAARVQAEAQALAPEKTGALKRSIQITFPTPLTAVVGPRVNYGVYQEFGTGSRGEFAGTPYEIKARPGRTLAFEVGGKTVFAKRVMHPGVKARRFMRTGLEKALGSQIVADLAKAGALLITEGKSK